MQHTRSTPASLVVAAALAKCRYRVFSEVAVMGRLAIDNTYLSERVVDFKYLIPFCHQQGIRLLVIPRNQEFVDTVGIKDGDGLQMEYAENMDKIFEHIMDYGTQDTENAFLITRVKDDVRIS